MKKNNILKAVVIVLVAVVMLLPIIIEANIILKSVKYEDLQDTISKTSYYGVNLVYVAPKSLDDIKENQENIRDLAEDTIVPSTNESLVAYYMDYDKLSSSEKKEVFGDSKEKIAYMFLVNGELLKVQVGEVDNKELTKLVNAYTANGISEDLQHFNVAEDSKAFSKLVKQKNDVTMVVFGKDSCFYCNQFKVVYNTVAEEENLDSIYYFDSDSYDKDEYEKIMNMGLMIPAACSETSEDVSLQEGFNTPLTLFTKNGKAIDCISGYINKESLLTKLETVGILESSDDKEDESDQKDEDKTENTTSKEE